MPRSWVPLLCSKPIALLIRPRLQKVTNSGNTFSIFDFASVRRLGDEGESSWMALPNFMARYFLAVAFARPDTRVIIACWASFLTSGRVLKSTPQKLACGCRDSIPACNSLGAS